MKKKRIKLWILLTGALGLFAACKQKAAKFSTEDTYTKGTLTIVADESFAPVLDQELYVFKSLYKEADLHILYKTENEAFRLFLNDSVRVIISARNLNSDEIDLLKRKTLPPEINCFAHDGVTMIVNHSVTDTLSSVNQIKEILNGKTKTDKNIVFDNANSSITRYLEHFAGVTQFNQKNVYSLNSNVEVIKYVSEHTNAIGFISYSWLLEPDDYYAPFVNKIKIVGVKDEQSNANAGLYFKPSQNSLAMHQYPLVRNLFVINSTGRTGLGEGFANFLVSERGQRIILRAGLLPDSIPTREVTFGN